MKSLDFLNEGIGEDAHEMHLDHEVQMARQELYHAAEDAIALHKLLRHVSEQQGLEGWVSSKITLAADYLKTIREHLEYQMMSGGPAENITTMVGNVMPVAEGSEHRVVIVKGPKMYIGKTGVLGKMSSHDAQRYPGHVLINLDHGAGSTILPKDAVKKQGVAEAYTSDEMVSILSGAKTQAQVDADRKAAAPQQTTPQPAPQQPQQPAKKVNERKNKSLAEGQMKKAMEADAERMDLDEFLAKWAHSPEDEQWMTEFWNGVNSVEEGEVTKTATGLKHKATNKYGAGEENSHYSGGRSGWANPGKYARDINSLNKQFVKDLDASMGITWKNQGTKGVKVDEMSAGSVATVVNPAGKNKAKVGSLFGGTYKQSKPKAK